MVAFSVRSFKPFCLCGVAFVVIFWCFVAYGYYIGRFKLTINRIEYSNHQVPKLFDGYKIVQISDLHLDSFGSETEPLERLVDSINAQSADLVCITGDIVNRYADEAKPYVSILRRIKAKDGVVSILGNHDFGIYYREFTTDAQRDSSTAELVRIEESMGWRVLRDENIVIRRGSDSITIVGVDNIKMGGFGFKTISKGNLKKALEGASGFQILLTHDPTHWRNQVISETDIPLTLSGHTHAAQMILFGFTPAVFLFPDAKGLFVENNQTLYINQGIGCTLPFRIGADEEITVITLKNE